MCVYRIVMSARTSYIATDCIPLDIFGVPKRYCEPAAPVDSDVTIMLWLMNDQLDITVRVDFKGCFIPAVKLEVQCKFIMHVILETTYM